MNKHYIVGTAGHIDHGKTTLSKALTGKDTDRLKEEKERNITIELGFAPFKLPNGNQVSLIDVPGHERFIRHMVAGVGGIDLFLLIISAEEGIMPQTKEHLQIINLLGIKEGIIVLTKKDLVEEEFLEMVIEEVKDYIHDTNFKNVPIIPVSSTNYEGIEALKLLIQKQLEHIPERPYSGFFRMPIDRIFTLKGIGTVITGTVHSGMVEVGQELEIMPSKLPVRIRSLHVHSESVSEAFAGQRVAINPTGVDLDDLNRGDSIVSPNQWYSSNRIDIEFNILPNIDFTIKQNSQIKLHIGTTEVLGTIFLYDRKEANAGETIYCQVKLEEPIISSRNERFIIRRPSPAITIGGGIIIEPNAKRHKYNQETVENLKQRLKGSVDDLILNYLFSDIQIFLTLNDLSNLLTLPEKEVEEIINILIQHNKAVKFVQGNKPFYTSKERFDQIEKDIIKHLNNYHLSNPSRMGQPKVEFTNIFFPFSKLKITQEIIKHLEYKNVIKTNEEYLSLLSFNPSLPNSLREKAKIIEEKLIKQKFSPDNWEDITHEIGLKEKEKLEIYNYLLNQRKIVKLNDKMVIHYKSFEELKKMVTNFLEKEKQITLQQAKDLLQVSRKFLVPLMELLDTEKVTVLRQGNNHRELRKNYS